MTQERRQSPRIEILGRLHGHIAALDVPITVLDISLGGLSLQASVAFPPGVIHEFKLTLGDGSSSLMRGKVLRSREVRLADGSHAFVTGVRFVADESPEAGGSIGGLIDRMKS
jgi:hypothetical protein